MVQGVYIHIPFCKQACNYCDFHFSTNLINKASLTESICTEIALRHNYLGEKQVNSIYFGGGTPSLLSFEELERILKSLSEFYDWTQDIEICLEANPDDINKVQLEGWKKLGINRLSIGLQSFNNEELKWMNRAHSAEQSLSSVKLAQDAGFSNITIDLIYGSKFQSLKSWEDTLKQAIELNTQHISSYNLTIEEKTGLGHQYAKGKEPEINDELSSQQFLLMKEMFEKAGFVHYEISNFGKPGYYAKHNSNYWLQHPYLGLGPSAHSFNGTSRQWNVKNNAAYIKALANKLPFFEKEELSLNDRFNEYMLTRLRTAWGCNVNEMQKLFGTELATSFKVAIAKKGDLIKEQEGVYTLTDKGLLKADGIASDLFVL